MKSICQKIEKLNWPFLLLVRLTLGIVFIESGWGKIHNTEKVIQYFTSLHIPAPVFQAHLVAWMEFIGGLFVMVGFLTRLISIPLLMIMIVAIITTQIPAIKEFSDLLGTIEFLYALLFIGLIVQGAGLLSIDHLLKNFKTKR